MWHPANLLNMDGETWNYTNRDRHFWPPEGTVPEDAALIIDVGANAGLSTGLFADAWQQAKVIGIEMNPETADRARSNLVAFGDRVEIVTSAVGYPERTDIACFTSANAVDHLKKYIWLEGQEHEVQVRMLDTILVQCGVGSQQIDLLKMDIEGSELEVLNGPCWWAKRTKVFVLEAHSQQHAAEDFVGKMEKLGFDVHSNEWGQLIGVRS